MNSESTETSHSALGLRFGLGVALIVAGYAALALIPAVTSSSLSTGAKTGLAGLLAITPFMSKVAAVAVMGKPGFNILKKYIFSGFGRLRPAEQVSRQRYTVGLAMFVGAIIFGSLLPYFPGYFVNWQANEIFWSLVTDAVMIASLFVLGGDFWNKLAALFTHDSKVIYPDQDAALSKIAAPKTNR